MVLPYKYNGIVRSFIQMPWIFIMVSQSLRMQLISSSWISSGSLTLSFTWIFGISSKDLLDSICSHVDPNSVTLCYLSWHPSGLDGFFYSAWALDLLILLSMIQPRHFLLLISSLLSGAIIPWFLWFHRSINCFISSI